MSIMDGQHIVDAAAGPKGASTSASPPPRQARLAAQTQLLRASSSKTKASAFASSSSCLSPSPSPSALPSTSTSSCATPSSSSSSPTHSLTPSPIPPEPDKRGNLEYKLRILPVSPSRFSRLVTQLKWRLAEGGGLAVYEIGVLDDGTLIGLPREEMRSSLMQLGLMGERLGAGLEVRRCIVVERGQQKVEEGEGEGGEGEAPPSPSSPADSHLVPYRHRLGSSSKNQSPGLDNIVGLRSLNNAEAAKFLGHAQARTGTLGDDAAATAHSWRYEIAPQLSDSGNATAEDGGDDEQDSRSDDSPASGDDDDDEGEDDGFAFSLSLSDDESKQPLAPPAGAQGKPKARRRSSRSISNSPWQRFASPNTSSAASSSPVMRPSSTLPPSPARRPSAQSVPAVQANGSSSSPMSTPPLDPHQPSDEASSSSPPSSSSRAASPYTATSSSKRFIPAGGVKGEPTPPLSRRSSFTDLAGMDVEGVLRFALPPRVEKSAAEAEGGLTGRAASNARRRAQRDAKRAQRRLEEEARKGEGMMSGNGEASSAPSAAATPSTNEAEPSSSSPVSTPPPAPVATSSPPTTLPAPSEVLRLSLERKEAKLAAPQPSHSRIGRNSNSATMHKLERRRRREIEHLAKEREGAGELLAMAVEHELDLPDEGVLGRRSDWWRFSGLSLEGDLPGFDATKQGWVREVADWLTVKEVMELCTARPRKPGGPGAASSSDADEEDEPKRRAAAVAAAAAAAIEAKIPAAVNKAAVDEGLSRRAQARRRKKDRKKQEEAAAAGVDAVSSSPAATPACTPPPPYVARPHYLPPPASAVAIPSSSASKASAPAAQRHPRQSSSPLHPLARSQTFDDDDDDEEEEDSFSMGLTLNIDDFPDSMGSPTAAQRGAPTGSSTASSTIAATSPSPSSSTTTTATLMMGAAALTEEKEEKEEGAEGGEQASSSSPEQAPPAQMRFIVEAVLSLKAIQGRR